jgi:hypothetical protein
MKHATTKSLRPAASHSMEMSCQNEGALAPALRAFADDLRVAPQAGRFGGYSLRVNDVMFAMAVQGRLALKLPPATASALVDAGAAAYLVLGARTMRQWVVVDDVSDDILRDARDHALLSA